MRSGNKAELEQASRGVGTRQTKSLRHLIGVWMMLASASFLMAQFGPPKITKGVGLDQKLNAQVPLDLNFRDEANRLMPLRTYFGDKPVVLALVYYKCPGLCPMTLSEMTDHLRRVSLKPGRDYEVVVVSIDPKETPEVAAEAKAKYAAKFKQAGFYSGWHFLTGTQDAISRLTAAVGFRYRWDKPTHQFVHAAGIVVATPDGRLSRYFYGVQYAPQDLRLALVEASQHKIGSPVDYFLLYCCQYDPSTGRYTLAIVNVLKVAGALTIIGLGGLIFFLMKYDPRRKKKTELKEAHHAG